MHGRYSIMVEETVLTMRESRNRRQVPGTSYVRRDSGEGFPCRLFRGVGVPFVQVPLSKSGAWHFLVVHMCDIAQTWTWSRYRINKPCERPCDKSTKTKMSYAALWRWALQPSIPVDGWTVNEFLFGRTKMYCCEGHPWLAVLLIDPKIFVMLKKFQVPWNNLVI